MATATASRRNTKTVRIAYEQTDKQREFHDKVLTKRWTAFCGGIRSGKTVAGCHEMIRQAMVLQPGSEGACYAPTYPMLRDVVLPTMHKIIPPEIMANFHKSDMRLVWPCGGNTIFRSMEEPKNQYGTTLDYIWLEEPSLMAKQAWDIAQGRLSGKSGKRRGWGTMTPKGRIHWTGKEFAVENEDHGAVFVRTEDNAKNLPLGYIEEMRRAYTGKFAQQELDGLFVSFEGLIYDIFDEAIHIRQRPVQEFKEFYGAQDWGHTAPGCAGVFGIDGDGRKHWFEEIYQPKMLPSEWASAWLGLMQRYPVQRVFCGPDRPENIELYRREGIPAEAANDDVIDGICSVTAALNLADGSPGCTFDPGMVHTGAEMRQYQWQQNKDGSLKRDVPLKINDHSPDMVRYGLHSVKALTAVASSLEVFTVWNPPTDEDEN